MGQGVGELPTSLNLLAGGEHARVNSVLGMWFQLRRRIDDAGSVCTAGCDRVLLVLHFEHASQV